MKNIDTVTVDYSPITGQQTCYVVRFTDSEKVLSVPLDEENRHYQEILEWVAEGNTITDNGGSE